MFSLRSNRLRRHSTSLKIDDMGRRKISEKDKRKVQVNIRLTDEEFEKITTYSTGSALSPAN